MVNMENVVQPNMGGPTGSPNPDLGALAHGILQLFEQRMDPLKGVLGRAMGPGENPLENYQNAVGETSRFWRENVHVPEVSPLMLATGPAGVAAKALEATINNMQHLGPMALDQATDLTNLVGLGLPGRAATALQTANTAGHLAPEALVKVLQGMQWMESAPGMALMATLRGGVKAGRVAAGSELTGPIAQQLAKRAPIFETEPMLDTARAMPAGVEPLQRLADTKITPTSLLQWMEAMSANSKVHQRDRDLGDAWRIAQAQGHNLEDALAEMGNAKSMFLPSEIAAKGDFASDVNRLKELEDRIWGRIAEADDPRVKLAGVELMGQVQEQAMRTWETMLVDFQKGGGASTGGTGQARWTNFYAGAYNELQRLYQAGDRAMANAERAIGKLPKLAPETEAQFSQLADYSHQVMGGIRTAPSTPQMGLMPQADNMKLWGPRVEPTPATQERIMGMMGEAPPSAAPGPIDQLMHAFRTGQFPDPAQAGTLEGRAVTALRGQPQSIRLTENDVRTMLGNIMDRAGGSEAAAKQMVLDALNGPPPTAAQPPRVMDAILNAMDQGPPLGGVPPGFQATDLGRLGGLQGSTMDMFRDAVMPQRQALEDALKGIQDTVLGIPKAMRGQMLDPASANSFLTQGRAQTEMLELGLPAFLADMPAYYRNVVMQHLPVLEGQLKQIVGPPAKAGEVSGGKRGLFEKTLRDLFESQTLQKYVPKDPTADTLTHFNDVLQNISPDLTARMKSMFPDGIKTGVDFIEATRGLVPTSVTNSLRSAMKQYPGGDLLTADTFQLAHDRVIRQYASSLGIEPETNPLLKAFDLLMNIWKESAVLAPGYHETNTLGALFNQHLQGVNPLNTVESLGENMGKILLGGPQTDITPRRLQVLLDRLEVPQRAGASGASAALLRDETYNLVREMTGKGTSASEQIGSVKLGGLGALGGGLAGERSSASDADPWERARNFGVGAALGGGLGLAFPKLSAKSADIGRGLEDVFRKETFAEGLRRGVTGRVAELRQIAADAMGYTPETILAGTGKPVIHPLPVGDAEKEAVLKIIDHEQGIMGPSMLEGLLRRANVDAGAAKVAADAWRDVIKEAADEGVKLSNAGNFDYKALNNVEEAIRRFVPFSTWSMKALPFFAGHLAEHPYVILKIAQMEAESAAESEQGGLGGRFAGAVRAPVADAVWSKLLGGPHKTYFNLLKGLVPGADMARQITPKPDETPMEAAVRQMQLLGLPGPGPAIEAPLRVIGAFGPEEPARGYIRQAGPIQALTAKLGINRGAGIDLNAPFVQGETMLRRAIGQTPTDLEQTAILNRLDEMALARTGFTTGSKRPEVGEFVNAKLEQSGPLWDEARRQATATRTRLSTGNFVAPMLTPQAVLNPQEETIRGTKAAVIPQDTQRLFTEIGTLAERSPQGDAHQYVRPLRTIAVQLSQEIYDQGVLPQGEISPRLEKLLQNPTATNVNEVKQSIMQELMRRNPNMAGYGQSGNPQESRLKVLLEGYNNTAALLKRDPANNAMTPAEIEQVAALATAIDNMGPGSQAAKMLAQGKDPLAQQLKYLKGQKDAFRKQPGNELLDKYLIYQAQQRGTGTMDGFFKTLTKSP